MQRLWITVLVSLILPLLGIDLARGAGAAPTSQDATLPAVPPSQTAGQDDSSQKVAYRLHFSDYHGGAVETWLESKGFKFEEAAKDPQALKLSVQNGALILEAKEQLRGFLFKDSLEIKNFSKVKLEWGILKYPEGASYERHRRNEALMVYISFGHEKLPSGNIVLPDMPYFIGLFLCKDDKLHTPYVGRYYQEGGRFVCLAQAEPQQTLVSEFDLLAAFRTYFEKGEVPPISGINLGVDTSNADDGGKAAAYIKLIEFIR
jgi:hypothetical protein